jgi:hypothetical protein
MLYDALIYSSNSQNQKPWWRQSLVPDALDLIGRIGAVVNLRTDVACQCDHCRQRGFVGAHRNRHPDESDRRNVKTVTSRLVAGVRYLLDV